MTIFKTVDQPTFFTPVPNLHQTSGRKDWDRIYFLFLIELLRL